MRSSRKGRRPAAAPKKEPQQKGKLKNEARGWGRSKVQQPPCILGQRGQAKGGRA